jgi:hypothetical protein
MTQPLSWDLTNKDVIYNIFIYYLNRQKPKIFFYLMFATGVGLPHTSQDLLLFLCNFIHDFLVFIRQLF